MPLSRLLARWCVLCLAWIQACELVVDAASPVFAAGDPGIRLRQVFPESQEWRTSKALAFELEIEHPLLRSRTTPDPWRLAPTNGWMSAARLVVTDAAGTEVNWPFRISATRGDRPLVLEPSETATVVFLLDPAAIGFRVTPGNYTIRGELAGTSGDGWRGRVISETRPVVAVGQVAPVVAVEPPDAGPLVAGWPWGVGVSLRVPPDPEAERLSLPGRTSTGWVSNLLFSVRDAAGRELSWPWITPRLVATQTDFVDPGDSSVQVFFRLPASATAGILPGNYTVRVGFHRPPQFANESSWSGTVESEPTPVTVVVAPANPGLDALTRRDRLEAMEALGEAADLRFLANDRALGVDGQVAQLRKTVEPLLRAEAAAQRVLLRNPSDPAASFLMSRVRLAQDDPLGALAWATGALMASSDPNDLASPFDVPAAGWQDVLRVWRQELESMPEVPDATLTPELEFSLDLARGTLPEPTTLAEQEKFFGLDPKGQWASSARASSEYRTTDYSAARATGAPNVRFYGDNVQAWATRLADAANEWIELTFTNPVPAAAVRVRQNFNPGAIVRVDLIDTAGGVQTVFQGTDTNVYPRATIGWFVVKFPTTAQPIERVRLSLDSVAVRGWNEIDAVQLVTGAVVPEVPPLLTLGPLDWLTGQIQILAWPAGYRLERANRLDPDAWSVVASSPPFTIQLTDSQEFFRLKK
jgi:hypothetical protein